MSIIEYAKIIWIASIAIACIGAVSFKNSKELKGRLLSSLIIVCAFVMAGFGTLEIYSVSIFTITGAAAGIYLLMREEKNGGTAIKIASAEALVYAISGMLFASIFWQDIFLGIIEKVVIFIIFAIISGFFVRNISQAEEEREELAQLNDKLHTMNEFLELSVKQRGGELAAAKFHSESIIDNLISGLIEFDKDGKVVIFNKSAEKIVGIPREKIIGKVPRKEFSEIPELLQKNPDGGNTQEVKIVKGDNPIYIEITTIGSIKIIHDITKDKIVSKNKSEFIAIAAHQMRTPLSAIKWTINVLMSGDLGKLSEKEIALLRNAYETNERMIGLINDLLDVAKIEEGKFGFQMEKTDLVPILRKIASIYENEARMQRLSFRFFLPKELPLVYCDPSKIELSLQNLLDNALNYTKEGFIGFGASTDGTSVIINVEDSGMGISKQEMGGIFTKFFRGSNARKTHENGTGLGLFIAKNIITRHGGNITIQSTEGRGTSFEITLPGAK